jgi:hypothetical protein
VECRFCREPLNWVEKKRVTEHMRSQKHLKAKQMAANRATEPDLSHADSDIADFDNLDDVSEEEEDSDNDNEDDNYEPDAEFTTATPPAKRRRKAEGDSATAGKKNSLQCRLKGTGTVHMRLASYFYQCRY